MIITASLLILPILFLYSHFATIRKEMSKREGIYVVSNQQKSGALCKGVSFDTLTITLFAEGNFKFNYRPCFSDKIEGKWRWTDNMVGSFTQFDNLNDTLSFSYPVDYLSDSFVVKGQYDDYLTFKKLHSNKGNYR